MECVIECLDIAMTYTQRLKTIQLRRCPKLARLLYMWCPVFARVNGRFPELLLRLLASKRYMAANSASPPNIAQSPSAPTNGIIQALGHAFKSQTGDALNNIQIAKLLHANIGQLGQLAKDGKLSQQQILQV
jgi:hypothetical protein